MATNQLNFWAFSYGNPLDIVYATWRQCKGVCGPVNIPGRLVDTNVVILDHAEALFDGGCIATDQPRNAHEDVDALRNIFWTGRRAHWQVAVSPITYNEIMATSQADRRAALDN